MEAFFSGVVTVRYILTMAGAMLLVRKLQTIPDALFRKKLHFILLGPDIPLV